jgi:PAS domain S-box-containing protein
MTADRLQRALVDNEGLRVRLEEAEDTLRAIRNGDVDAIVVGRDIYTLDTANAADNKLRRAVLSQMEDAVLAFDDGGHLIFMNAAAERQYGQSASALLGRGHDELYREVWPDEALRESCRRELLDTGSYRARLLHVKRNGEALHVECTVSRLRGAQGEPMGRLCVIRDVSARLAAEQTLMVASLALARREREFATLVENSPDIFARIDRELRHVYVSPVVQRHLGITPSTMLGKTFGELGLPAALCAQWNGALKEVFATGRLVRLNYAMNSAAQGERFFNARLMPEFGDDGSVESVLVIASDVTEQAQIDAAFHESQARLQFTLDSARIGEWELDLESDTARTSLRHDRCFGYDEPVGQWGSRVMLSHVHPADRDRIAALFQTSEATQQDLHFEARVLWPDGSLHWIEAHGVFYGIEGDARSSSRRLLGIVADITDRKLAEAALHDNDRRKDEFLATLAHELRNPLAPIRNALEIMQRSPGPVAQAHAREVIERQLGQMVHLVDDLLDVSRISQGKLELRRTRVDLAEVLKTAVETSRPLVDAGRHQLRVQLPPAGELCVDGDTTRLCQIVANLLNNAAKYTPEGGSIELGAWREEGRTDPENGEAVISVQDSGVGLSHDMLPRVFDMFAQVDRSVARAQGGLGIGLALVKQLVEMHGGTVEAHSEGVGSGCRFVVRLPLVAARLPAALATATPPPRVPAGATPAAAPGVLRVLVVDDNVDSAESLAEVLEMSGHQVRVAHDGPAALVVAGEFRPQAIVLDIGLPGLSGHEVAKRIRGEDWGRAIHLVALSGWGQAEDRKRSREAGFDAHFVKPVDLDELEAVLRRASERATAG